MAKNAPNEDLASVVTAEDLKTAKTFIETLKKRGKTDITKWKVIGKIQHVLEEKSAAMSATGKANKNEIGAFNKFHFPSVNAPTLSYAKRLYRDWDQVMSYRRAMKKTAVNNPMTLVQGMVKWQKQLEKAAADKALEAKIDGMTDLQKEVYLKERKTATRRERAAKALEKFVNISERVQDFIREGVDIYGADDLRKIHQSITMLDDCLAEAIKLHETTDDSKKVQAA